MNIDSNVVTIIVAVVAATGASLVSGFFMRPKVSAEARAASATGEVAISGDAREWAKMFEARAEKAEARADVAEVRSVHAEQSAKAANTRCDHLEERMEVAIEYIMVLQTQMEAAQITPIEPPAGLRPPL